MACFFQTAESDALETLRYFGSPDAVDWRVPSRAAFLYGKATHRFSPRYTPSEEPVSHSGSDSACRARSSSSLGGAFTSSNPGGRSISRRPPARSICTRYAFANGMETSRPSGVSTANKSTVSDMPSQTGWRLRGHPEFLQLTSPPSPAVGVHREQSRYCGDRECAHRPPGSRADR